MKTLKFLFGFFLVVIISASVFAKDNKTQTQKNINYLIKKEITYPQFAIENQIEGSVLIQYKVNEDGKIVIEKINYENVILGDYVKEKLSKINIDKSVVNDESSRLIRFDFKLQ
jgi:hypothetical protein